MFPATHASSGQASLTLPWAGDAPARRAGALGQVGELQPLPSLWMPPRKAGPETSPRLQVKDFHLAVLVLQRLFYLCVSEPLKILLGHISGELIETLR